MFTRLFSFSWDFVLAFRALCIYSVDDARLLLGIYYHGFGNWEKIRLDGSLGLTKKIAPVELQHHETFLPRAPNLRDRATALLEMVDLFWFFIPCNMKTTFVMFASLFTVLYLACISCRGVDCKFSDHLDASLHVFLSPTPSECISFFSKITKFQASLVKLKACSLRQIPLLFYT